MRHSIPLAFSLAVAGCSSSHSAAETLNGTVLLAAPSMMQTAVDPMVRPSLVLTAMPQPAAQPSDLELFEYTTEAPIPGVSQPGASPWGQEFEFVPDAALNEGWYTFQFKAWGNVGGGQSYVHPVTESRASGDVFESYFHVGSYPLVLSIQTCTTSTDSHSAFVLTFSEPIQVGNDLPVSVAANGKSLTCHPGTEFTGGPAGVAVDCDSASGSADFRVTVSEGMTAAVSSMPVRNGAGETHFAVDIPKEAVDHCRTWVETVPPVPMASH